MTLAASLTSATSLIFNAKGNPIGQALMIVFSLLYGVISYTFSYFGEMITYLGMTGPMALFALIPGCGIPITETMRRWQSIGWKTRNLRFFMC